MGSKQTPTLKHQVDTFISLSYERHQTKKAVVTHVSSVRSQMSLNGMALINHPTQLEIIRTYQVQKEEGILRHLRLKPEYLLRFDTRTRLIKGDTLICSADTTKAHPVSIVQATKLSMSII